MSTSTQPSIGPKVLEQFKTLSRQFELRMLLRLQTELIERCPALEFDLAVDLQPLSFDPYDYEKKGLLATYPDSRFDAYVYVRRMIGFNKPPYVLKPLNPNFRFCSTPKDYEALVDQLNRFISEVK
jgi:hypothetical protein